ncbi:MAG: F0F1 ATP synthase subunit B' [Rhodospirillaceae bacterium]|nr:F0F1 ATP synthase subunit B' [Rhodospirillaceae bacterium]
MPQLNFADYPPQLIWLAITFVLLYFLMSRLALPGVSRVLERRQAKIAADLEAAEKRRAEAEEALANYEKTLAGARLEAQAAVKAASDEMAKQQAQREATFAAEIGKRTREAEAQIETAKQRALTETRNVAGEIAGSITAKLAQMMPGADQIAAAVDAVRRERA